MRWDSPVRGMVTRFVSSGQKGQIQMRIIVLGATGTIGTKVTKYLNTAGHEVIQASRSHGVNAATGSGLHQTLADADIAIDCLNIETFSTKTATSFFAKTTHNVVNAARRMNTRHIICISIAGASDPKVNAGNGYYQGKAVQEKIYRASGLPVTIVHSTQWFELIDNLVQGVSFGPVTILPTMRMAPIAADSVASRVAKYATDDPPSGVQEIALRGPEIATGAELARAILAARGSVGGRRPWLVKELPFLGHATATDGLIPRDAIIDEVTLEDWLRDNAETT